MGRRHYLANPHASPSRDSYYGLEDGDTPDDPGLL
jgi:hypothetical protein